VKYLKQLTERFPDLRLALAAYNAGEGAVERYRNIPPYRETEEYVYRVGKTYGQARKAAQSAAPPAAAPAEPPSRPLEVSVDGEGRIHLRTR
jgi:soluble lytic murein transglycosylase-like protein